MLYISRDGKTHLLLQKLQNNIRPSKRRLAEEILAEKPPIDKYNLEPFGSKIVLNYGIVKYLNPHYLLYITENEHD